MFLTNSVGFWQFSPSSLFANGEEGAWYDPSDLSTMWTDNGITQAVVGDLIYRIDDKSGNGNHAVQATVGLRPMLKLDYWGTPYLHFNGVDDVITCSNASLGTDATYAVASDGAVISP
jgi:hypothetical protein